ncbi:MAG: hypothetical protein ACYC96_06355 [Fimbriimonadaceae bacterium]
MSLTAEPFDRKRLDKALSSEKFPEAHAASKSRIDYLEDHLRGLGVVSMITEERYTDGEYLEDFAAYYARCHEDYPRHCKRIHFLIKPEKRSAIHDAGVLDHLLITQDPAFIRDYQNAYLGFVVARPLSETIIGRTVLKPWTEIDGSKVRLFPLLPKDSAHLYGIEFPVDKSLAFQEQDSACGACATVALWSALQQASKLFGTLSPRPATITQLASPLHAVVLGRTLPSQGLSVLQMCEAIRATGLEPEVFRLRASESGPMTTEWLSLVQAYVTASVPVIIVAGVKGTVGLHAITICGLGYNNPPSDLQFESSTPPPIPLSGARLRVLYAHDDQRGPYCHYYPTDAIFGSDSGFLKEYIDPVPSNRTQRVLEPTYAIVPIYGKVRINFLDIQRDIAGISAVIAKLLGKTNADNFEWDVRLALANEYKAALRSKAEIISPYKELLQAQLPRFIWVTKLVASGQVFWEIVWDATDTPRSVHVVKSIWHSPATKNELAKSLAAGVSISAIKVRKTILNWFIKTCQS